MGLLDLFRAAPAVQQPKPAPGDRARGGSGRGHNQGFLELEELNAKLRHPQWHRVADEMFRTDGDVRQVIQLSMNPLVGGTWAVNPYGGEVATEADQLVAKVVRWALWEYMRPNLIGHLIEFLPVLLRSGFVPGEIVWTLADCPIEGAPDKVLVPKRIEMRLPRSVWKWNQRDGQLVSIEQFLPAGSPGGAGGDASWDWRRGDPSVAVQGGGSSSGDGSIVIPAKNLVYYRVGGEGDNWEGVSLLRPAYKHWFLKDKIERLDAIAQEREAMGIPVVYPPPSADDADLDAIEEALKQLRSNEQGYIVMPGMKAGTGAPDGQGWHFEIMGYDRSGSGRDPSPSLAYHTNKIAAAFIAEFMRLGHGTTGARATAQVQADPFMMSIEALSTIVEQVLNDSLVTPIVALNFADAKNPPRLANSLVDSTSLDQLAGFVLKLAQVGALLPDQELEDFLRARADLPPANAEAVRKRGDDEERIRRAIVGGDLESIDAGAEADPFGSNDPKMRGQKRTNAGGAGRDKRAGGGSTPRSSGAPKGAGGAGKGEPRGAAKNLDELGGYEAWHQAVDLDAIEWLLDDLPRRMRVAGEPHVVAAAIGAGGGDSRRELRDGVHEVLLSAYRMGRDHVCDELDVPRDDTRILDRGAIDRGEGVLLKRAEIAARQVADAMENARAMADLAHGDDHAHRAQQAAEQVGLRMLERVGDGHGSDAYQQGRHDAGVQLADSVMGARYSAILDRGTCPECEHADDGVLRPLEDPIRMDRRPPNRHCHSLASGFNRCRCFEIFEPMPPDDPQLTSLDDAPAIAGAGLGPLMLSIVRAQLARGYGVERAIAVAEHRLRVWAAGGSRISATTQQQAADELARWQATRL